MTDWTKPISASNPPPSKGERQLALDGETIIEKKDEIKGGSDAPATADELNDVTPARMPNTTTGTNTGTSRSTRTMSSTAKK